MTDSDDQRDQLIRLLAPVHDLPPSAANPFGDAANELLENIMRTSEARTSEAVTAAPAVRRSWFARQFAQHRRWAVAVPTVAALAALAFGITAALPTGPGSVVGPAPAGALQITEDDDFIIIKIVDPTADPQRYREELAKYHLDIELSLVPATPDQVGKVIFEEIGDTAGGPDIETIEAPGNCTANGNCSVGIKVPVAFRSYARIVFGRTALPGESLAEGGGPDGGTPEDNAQARGLIGKSVAEVLRILASRGQTASFRVSVQSVSTLAENVPADWIVYDAAPLDGKVFAIWVSVDGKAPRRPADSGGPTPTPFPNP